jgi:hypothetical protein
VDVPWHDDAARPIVAPRLLASIDQLSLSLRQ